MSPGGDFAVLAYWQVENYKYLQIVLYCFFVADAADPKITLGTKARLADWQTQWQIEKAKITNIKKSISNYNRLYKEKGLEAVQL